MTMVGRQAAMTSVVVAAATAVALASPGGYGAANGASQRCKPEGSSTVVVNDHVRVYRERSDPMSESEVGTMIACLRSNGRTADLDTPDDELAYRPPGLRLNGSLVAVATADNHSEDEFEPATRIYVWDLRRLVAGKPVNRAIVNGSFADRSNFNVRVGMIVLRTTGSIAWTTCPGSGGDNPIPNTPKPNCLAAGDDVRVWKLDIDTKRSRLLDRGTAVNPRSLRLKSGRVTWLNDGERRAAKLR